MFAMGPAFFGHAAASYATLTLTGTFAAATVGVAYSSSIPISGGLEPYSLTGGTGVASGSLDSGFSLSITGTTGARFLTLSCASPTTADTMTFTASVDSSDGQTATSAQSVVISISASDPYWTTVNTLLHFTGTNGSPGYTDETGHTWISVGTAPLLTTADYEFAPSSLALAGTGWIRSTTGEGNWSFAGNDLTMEAWIKPMLASDGGIISRRASGPRGWALEARANGAIFFRANIGGAFSDTAVSSVPGILTPNVWQHVALCRLGNTWTIYLNGAAVGASTLSGVLDIDMTANTAIGASTVGGENPFTGKIDELRVNNGHCYYTSAFTPSTQPSPNHA